MFRRLLWIALVRPACNVGSTAGARWNAFDVAVPERMAVLAVVRRDSSRRRTQYVGPWT
jgi:hypothetical protein